MCKYCEEMQRQNSRQVEVAPTLGRDTLRKIGQGLRAYYDPLLMLDPSPAMAVALEQLRSSAA